MDDIPPTDLPEIAFAGRSNVGKSSLINAIAMRNNLARTSKSPGCTRQLNFYNIGNRLMMVDLPGYGYAAAGHKEVAGWNRLVMDYLVGRPNLRRVFLLIDSRHGIKPNDRKIMNILDKSAVSYQIVLTKVDKQKKDAIEIILSEIGKVIAKHPALHPEILQTSSVKGAGLEILRARIADFSE